MRVTSSATVYGAGVDVTLLQPGTVLGERYEVLQLLGEGGMGAVYKSRDRELERVIALKVIRPELASRPEILQRFKQELILARQVTDRNVIRIFDLGEASGIKFITMEYVEGQSLQQILRESGKVAVPETLEIMRQTLCGLDAAHREGVIHRDLKPGNVMRDSQGRIVVMDFGLARSLGGDGMTQSGALLGTMEYMSPEQAQAKELDARSDIFTVGLICYELLTGKMPYHAESAIASLLRRTQERALPISDLDSTIPKPVSQIIARCLERDPELRYKNAREVLADLELYCNQGAAASLKFAHPSPLGRRFSWQVASAVAVVLVLASVGYLMRDKLFSPSSSSSNPAPVQPLTAVALLPFRNASGDPKLDWLGPSLAEMLSTDLGQSSSVRTISPNRLHQVFSDLRISPETVLDPQTIRRVADSSSADRVVWGQYAKFGDQIRIDATLQDVKNQRSVPLKIEAQSEKEIPAAVDHLADSIRQKLALPDSVLKELKASSFQPSTKSVAALRGYNQGIQLMRQGKNLDAVNAFQGALKEDPQFALALSRLAESDSALGYDSDAEQNSRKALDLAGDLPVQEKYLIEASHARVVKDKKKAIEAYENLARVSPEDPDIRFALGTSYEDSENLAKARENFDAVLKADPNNLNALLAVGRVAIKNGDTQSGLDPLNHALSLAVQFDNQEQKALILLAMGIAYQVLNKPEEALRDFQQSLEINRKLGQKRGVAASLIEIAQVQNTLGRPDAALVSYKQALDIQREIGEKKEMGDTLINIGDIEESRGQHDSALDMYKQSLQIQRDAGDETYQALCLSNIGKVYSSRGDWDNALTYQQQALQLREKLNVPGDIADSLHNEGEAYANIGQHEQAMSNYMRALELYRKAGDQVGVAGVSRAMGLVFESQGRYGAAVNSIQDALTSLRGTGEKSPRVVQFLADLS
ncbi:MAG: tetratricopeptide repeat protein, partial [Acidobacteriota bacterium]|nr:tetratricopeptide repeat protein [Acidobacteriota bacterium]